MAAVRAHPSRLEREREERNFECQEAEEGDPEDVVACQPKHDGARRESEVTNATDQEVVAIKY